MIPTRATENPNSITLGSQLLPEITLFKKAKCPSELEAKPAEKHSGAPKSICAP